MTDIGAFQGTPGRILLERVRDLDNGLPKGIYEFSSPPPKYVITEVKMNTKGAKGWKPKLDTKVTGSGGSQMSEKWVEFNLKSSLGDLKAMEVNAHGYEKVLVGVTKNSSPILESLGKSAKNINKIKVVN